MTRKKQTDDFQKIVAQRVDEYLFERSAYTLAQARANNDTIRVGLAFSEFCVRDVLAAFHDLGDSEEIERSLQCDASKDLGIDFIRQNEDRYIIIQMKYKHDGGNLDPADVSHFLGVDGRIFGPMFQKASPNVRQMLTDIKKTSAIEYHLVTNGRISDDLKQEFERGRSAFEKKTRNLGRGPVEWNMLDGSALHEKYDNAPFAEDHVPEKVVMAVRTIGGAFGPVAPCAIDMTQCLAQAGDQHKSIVMIMTGTDIKALYKKEGRNLFHANIRYYLGGKTKVNDELRATLMEKPHEFYIFNNGISAICNKMQINSSGKEVVCGSFQIINGAQTVATIGNFTDDAKLKKVNVMLRITELGNAKNEVELGRQIIHHNNRQTAMGHADFRANDPIQRFIEREFQKRKVTYRREPPHAVVVYQRKREFKRLPKGQVSISLAILAKALYAYHEDKPARLYSTSDFVFNTDMKRNGKYPTLFWNGDEGEVSSWPADRTRKVIAIAILQIHLEKRLKKQRIPYERGNQGGRNSVQFMSYSMGWQILWGFGTVVREFHSEKADEIYKCIIQNDKCLTEQGFVSEWFTRIEQILQEILSDEQRDLENTAGKGATLNFKAWMRNVSKVGKIKDRINIRGEGTFPLPF